MFKYSFMKMSPIIAGCMRWGIWGAKFNTDEYLRMINTCIDADIDTFDHADIYGDYTTEEEFGNALAKDPTLRNRVKIITKCGIRKLSANRPHHLIKSYDTSKEHIIASAEKSLENLHSDHLDVLLIHRPDILLDPAEVAEAFTSLQQSGKVLSFGVSNFTASQAELLRSYFPIHYNQLEISVQHLDPLTDGTLDHCLQHKIVPMAWAPFGGGNLFREESDERALRIMAVAGMLAEKYLVTVEQVLLNWLFMHPSGIHPIVGSTKSERLQNAIAAASFKMAREEWYMLWRASTGKEVA